MTQKAVTVERASREARMTFPNKIMKRMNCIFRASLENQESGSNSVFGSEPAIAPAPMSRIPKIMWLGLEVLLLALALLLGGIKTARAATYPGDGGAASAMSFSGPLTSGSPIP